MAANLSDSRIESDLQDYDWEDEDDVTDDTLATADDEPARTPAARGRRKARPAVDIDDVDLAATDIDLPVDPPAPARAGRRAPVWRQIDEYREEKRLRALLREVYDE